MQFIKSIIVAAAALAAAQAHAGYTYSFTTLPAGEYAAPAFTDGVKASTQTSSVPNVYMQPQGVTGSFLVVSNQNGTPDGQATIATGGVTSYSFVWGSPDTFNVIDIYGSATGPFAAEYTGANLASTYGITTNGNNANTGLFTITATAGSVIDHLVLKSSGVAFEIAAPVPEPETYALMLAGLGALGLMARRRKQA